MVGIIRQEKRRRARIMFESEWKQVLGHHGSSLTRREGAEVGPRTLQIASFACCRYPSCPICPRCVSGNVLGERHKVRLIANQDEEELTVIHGHQDAHCKILTVKVAVSS